MLEDRKIMVPPGGGVGMVSPGGGVGMVPPGGGLGMVPPGMIGGQLPPGYRGGGVGMVPPGMIGGQLPAGYGFGMVRGGGVGMVPPGGGVGMVPPGGGGVGMVPPGGGGVGMVPPGGGVGMVPGMIGGQLPAGYGFGMVPGGGVGMVPPGGGIVMVPPEIIGGQLPPGYGFGMVGGQLLVLRLPGYGPQFDAGLLPMVPGLGGRLVAEYSAGAGMVPASVDKVTGMVPASVDKVAAVEKLKVEPKEGPDVSSGSNHELRSMFEEWAAKYGKVYCSVQEREERFQIFLSTMKQNDKLNLLTGCTYDLTKDADLRPTEFSFGGGLRGKVPGPPPGCMVPDHTKGMKCEELKEVRMVFEKWAAEHGKVYGSEKEQHDRFLKFLDNKCHIDAFNRDVPAEDRIKLGGSNMDCMWWEVPVGGEGEVPVGGEGCSC